MNKFKSIIPLCAFALLSACGGAQSSDSAGPATPATPAMAPASGESLSADQLAQFVTQEGHVYNMVAPIVKGYTMSDPNMTKETIMPRRKKIVGWGTRLKRMGADIDAVFPELANVEQGADTPTAALVQQEAMTYNMVAPIVKGYTMSDPNMTKETIMPRRKKIVGWGMRIKALGGHVDAVFPELK